MFLTSQKPEILLPGLRCAPSGLPRDLVAFQFLLSCHSQGLVGPPSHTHCQHSLYSAGGKRNARAGPRGRTTEMLPVGSFPGRPAQWLPQNPQRKPECHRIPAPEAAG